VISYLSSKTNFHFI